MKHPCSPELIYCSFGLEPKKCKPLVGTEAICVTCKENLVSSKLPNRWKLLSSALSASFKARELFTAFLMINSIKIVALPGKIFAESCLGKPEHV